MVARASSLAALALLASSVAAQTIVTLNMSQPYLGNLPAPGSKLYFEVYPPDANAYGATITATGSNSVIVTAQAASPIACPSCGGVNGLSEPGISGTAYFVGTAGGPVPLPYYFVVSFDSSAASGPAPFSLVITPAGIPPAGVLAPLGVPLPIGTPVINVIPPSVPLLGLLTVPPATTVNLAATCYTGYVFLGARLDGFSTPFDGGQPFGPTATTPVNSGGRASISLSAFTSPLTYYIVMGAPSQGSFAAKCKLLATTGAAASPSPATPPPIFSGAPRLIVDGPNTTLSVPSGGTFSFFYVQVPPGPSLYAVTVYPTSGSVMAAASFSGFPPALNGYMSDIFWSTPALGPGSALTLTVPQSRFGSTIFFQMGTNGVVASSAAVRAYTQAGPGGATFPAYNLRDATSLLLSVSYNPSGSAYYYLDVYPGQSVSFSWAVGGGVPGGPAASKAIRVRTGSTIPTTVANTFFFSSEVNVTAAAPRTDSCSAPSTATSPVRCVWQVWSLSTETSMLTVNVTLPAPVPSQAPSVVPQASSVAPQASSVVPKASSAVPPASTPTASATPVAAQSATPSGTPSGTPSVTPATTRTPYPSRSATFTPSPTPTQSPAPQLQPFTPYVNVLSPQQSVQYAGVLPGGTPYTLSLQATGGGCFVAQGYYTLDLQGCATYHNCTAAFSVGVCSGDSASPVLALSATDFPLYVVIANTQSTAVTASMYLGAVSPTPSPSSAPSGLPFSRLQPNEELSALTLAAGSSSLVAIQQPPYSNWAVFLTTSAAAVQGYVGYAGFPACTTCPFDFTYKINTTRNGNSSVALAGGQRLLLGASPAPVTYSGNVSVPMVSTAITLYVRVVNNGAVPASFSVALLPPGTKPSAVPVPTSGGGSIGPIAGGIIGGIAAIILIVCLIRCNRTKRRRGGVVSQGKRLSGATATTVVMGAGGAAYPVSYVDFGGPAGGQAMELPGVVVPNPAVGVSYGRSSVL